jgi:hypothetical protein
MGKGELLRDEIDHLASLFEYGALQAATSPAEFLARVSAEVVLLRNRVADAEAKGRRMGIDEAWLAVDRLDVGASASDALKAIRLLKEKVKP